jgi:hypothetical protein
MIGPEVCRARLGKAGRCRLLRLIRLLYKRSHTAVSCSAHGSRSQTDKELRPYHATIWLQISLSCSSLSAGVLLGIGRRHEAGSFSTTRPPSSNGLSRLPLWSPCQRYALLSGGACPAPGEPPCAALHLALGRSGGAALHAGHTGRAVGEAWLPAGGAEGLQGRTPRRQAKMPFRFSIPSSLAVELPIGLPCSNHSYLYTTPALESSPIKASALLITGCGFCKSG